jgi:DNA-binding MarR family transcriptional regulator
VTSKRDLIDELCAEVRAAQVAVAAVDQAVADRLGVNATDHRCLDLLDQQGPMTAGALASALDLSTSAVTAVIDRLERLRYVRRLRDRSDRRKIQVELTPFLRRRASELYGPGEAAAAVLQRYSRDELRLLLDFVRRDRAYNEARGNHLRGATRSPERRIAGERGSLT